MLFIVSHESSKMSIFTSIHTGVSLEKDLSNSKTKDDDFIKIKLNLHITHYRNCNKNNNNKIIIKLHHDNHIEISM